MAEIISAIATEGVFSVIIGVILYLVIRWQANNFERKKEQAETEAQKQKEESVQQRDLLLINTVKDLLIDFQKQQQPEHTVEEEDRNRHLNEFITRQLDCLVEEGADRAFYISLHNGGKDLAGRGFLKMSIMEESVDTDVPSIMSKYQNLPRALFTTLYKELNEKDFYDVEQVEDIRHTDPMTYQFLKEHGVKVAFFRPVKRTDGLMIGIVGMEYINNDCVDTKGARKNVDKKTNRIVGALMGQEDNKS